MKKSSSKRKITDACLKSALIVCILLLCALIASLVQLTLPEKEAATQTAFSPDNASSGKNTDASLTAPHNNDFGQTSFDSPESGQSDDGPTKYDPGQSDSSSAKPDSGQADDSSANSDSRQADGSSAKPDSGQADGSSAKSNSGQADDSSAKSDSGQADSSSANSDSGQADGSTDRSDNHDSGKSNPETNTDSEMPKDTTLVFAGDVYFSDYVLASFQQSGIRGILSESLLNELKEADITMVNNEFPYSTRGTPAPDKQFTFRIDPSYVSILKKSGVDLVTLANNHVLDYGTEALKDTFQTLDEAGIRYAGAGNSKKRAKKLITKKAGGHTFGFLAASRVFPVASWNVENAQPGVFSAYDPSGLIAAVQDARSHCDFLCVYVHWGIERNTTPEPYQTSMAHALIDAGADAVIGAHPHVLQGVEFYEGKPIFYSLGNFIFYQTIERTAIAKLTLAADGKARWQMLPAAASNACTSLLTDAAACEEFYEYMGGLSTNVHFSRHGTVTPVSKR